jgi:Dolichyl-phosphate-mannose-protein mannosyltransferase
MTVAGVIPLVALIPISWMCAGRQRLLRASIISAAVAWGAAVALITEGLSLVRLLSFGPVLAAWLVVIAAALLGYAYTRSTARPASAGPSVSLSAWWPLAGLIILVALVGVAAMLAPPNTMDSLVYHMPRIAQWIQHGSVEHFPTHVLRQLHLGPWAEYAMLQLQILAGGDRFANFVQWLAMVGALVAVSLVTEQLGGGRRCQMLSAVACATIPMGLLQASGTQNDYVVAFWLVCFVSFGYALAAPGRGHGATSAAVWTGTSLGLALLTKATAFLFALPLLAWLLLGPWRRARLAGRTFAIVLACVAALNSGHLARNMKTYGSPLGPGREGLFVYANEAFGPSVLLSNAIRNTALHLGTPDESVNAAIERLVAWLHRRIGRAVDDPKTTWLTTTFHVRRPTAHEDLAGNPLHLALIVMSTALLLATWKPAVVRWDMVAYAGALVGAFVVFGWYLKWQPWHSRLHLPLFVLWSPLIGRMLGPHRRTATTVAAVLLALAVPWVVYAHSRPLLGPNAVFVRSRADQYFANVEAQRDAYRLVGQRLRGLHCATIGLWVDYNSEYLLWVELGHEAGGGGVRIEHVAVLNESARHSFTERKSFDPCAVVVITDRPDVPRLATLNGALYGLRLDGPPVYLFVKQAPTMDGPPPS